MVLGLGAVLEGSSSVSVPLAHVNGVQLCGLPGPQVERRAGWNSSLSEAAAKYLKNEFFDRK
jgi:hypothetical protein